MWELRDVMWAYYRDIGGVIEGCRVSWGEWETIWEVVGKIGMLNGS